MVEVTFLGSGGAFTDFRENYHTAVLVRVPWPASLGLPKPATFLIDCGPTAVQSLKELGVHPTEIDSVVITHVHSDHIGGLEQLIWERYYTGSEGSPSWETTPIVAHHKVWEQLSQALAPGLDVYTNKRGFAVSGGLDDLVTHQQIVKLPDSHRMYFVAVPHVGGMPCYGVLLKSFGTGETCFYTSDCQFQPDIGQIAEDAAIIFHDCSFTPKYPGTVHTHYGELLTLPNYVRRKIVLMHHGKVPESLLVLPVEKDGFVAAARKHMKFTIAGGAVRIGMAGDQT
jgi:ribonuclease BN (tRNA processing enzyme)